MFKKILLLLGINIIKFSVIYAMHFYFMMKHVFGEWQKWASRGRNFYHFVTMRFLHKNTLLKYLKINAKIKVKDLKLLSRFNKQPVCFRKYIVLLF